MGNIKIIIWPIIIPPILRLYTTLANGFEKLEIRGRRDLLNSRRIVRKMIEHSGNLFSLILHSASPVGKYFKMELLSII